MGIVAERPATAAAALTLTMALLPAAACSSGSGEDDSGAAGADGGVADGGRRGLCPLEPNPACTRASDCGEEAPKQSNCAACRPYNAALCKTAACETPPLLEAGDPLNLVFQVGSLEPELASFAGAVLATETAGGNTVACEDVYLGRVDLGDPCYNLVFSRGFAAIAQSGDTFTFTFSRVPGGEDSLLLVYGHALENAEGAAIGVSCTAVAISAPGGGRKDVPGDMMRRIQ